MLGLSPSGHSGLGCCHILEPDWLGSQGWSVLGLRELGACGKQRASTMNLECLLPSRYRPDNLRDWNLLNPFYIYIYDTFIYILIYIKQMIKKYLLNSIGKFIEHTVIIYMWKRNQKRIEKCLFVSIIESSSCTSETNTTRNQLYSNRKEQENYS